MGEPSLQKSDAADPIIGRVINGRFEVLSLIARGGMGRVYRARQQPLGRLVAIKILDPRQSDKEDQDFQARFFLEASTAAKLSHPNTVTVFDYGKTDDNVFYIVMELVEGRTLAAVLKDSSPMDPQKAVHICVQIARSLREAHSIGIVHRDLKPANVLVTKHADEDDFAKVLDFGLVKNTEDDVELTQAGLFMGSPKYMAPEQIQGGEVDGRTDVYALGCVLYYMLVGRVPFDRENQVQILMAHCRDAVPPMLRDDGVPIPQGLIAVTMRCLAKDKEQRFAGMNEVIAAMKHASSQAGVTLQTSGSFTLTDIELSGMRDLPKTPAGGLSMDVSFTPAGGLPPNPGDTALMSVMLGAPQEEPRGGGLKWALVGVVALAAAGAAFMATRRDDSAAIAESQAQATAAAQQTGATVAPAPTAPPVAPADARVHINVTSNPPGADIIIDDQPSGLVTPAEIDWSGERAARGRDLVIRFVKVGYQPASLTRTIDADRIEVNADLRPVVSVARPRPQPAASDTPMVDRPTGRDPRYLDSPY